MPDLADRLIDRVLDPDLARDVVLDGDVLPDPGGWEEDQQDEENWGLDDDPVVGAKGDEDAGDEEHEGGLEGGQVDAFGGEGAPNDEEDVSEADDGWVGPAEVLLVVGVSSGPAWNVDQNGVHNQGDHVKYKHDRDNNNASPLALSLDFINDMIYLLFRFIHFICEDLQGNLISQMIDFKVSKRGKHKGNAHEDHGRACVGEVIG